MEQRRELFARILASAPAEGLTAGEVVERGPRWLIKHTVRSLRSLTDAGLITKAADDRYAPASGVTAERIASHLAGTV
jgi:hypothetical protein